MKRDMDLIRSLLLEIEKGQKSFDFKSRDQDDGFLRFTFDLMKGAEFIEANVYTNGASVRQLKWKGCDFLDSVRDPKIWQKTKDGAHAAGGFTIDLLSDLAKGFVKQQIKQKTGIEI